MKLFHIVCSIAMVWALGPLAVWALGANRFELFILAMLGVVTVVATLMERKAPKPSGAWYDGTKWHGKQR